MKKDLQKCVDMLLDWGLTIEMIDIDILEKDLLWWQDVDMTCSFYVDKCENF